MKDWVFTVWLYNFHRYSWSVENQDGVFFIWECNIRSFYQLGARILLSWRQVRKRRDARRPGWLQLQLSQTGTDRVHPEEGTPPGLSPAFPFGSCESATHHTRPEYGSIDGNLLRSYTPVACSNSTHISLGIQISRVDNNSTCNNSRVKFSL